MTLSNKQNIKCPQCGHESEFEFYKSINTMINPELKEKVCNGDIFKFTCPNCGEETIVAYPFLYHMMESQTMIYLVGEDSVEDTAKIINKSKDLKIDEVNVLSEIDYRIRIVTSVKDLLEKIDILEDKYDDKAIELIKVLSELNLVEANTDIEYDDIVYVNDFNKGKAIVFINGGKPVYAVEISEELYTEHMKIAKLLKTDEDESYTIDRNWAFEQLEEFVGNSKDAMDQQ